MQNFVQSTLSHLNSQNSVRNAFLTFILLMKKLSLKGIKCQTQDLYPEL